MSSRLVSADPQWCNFSPFSVARVYPGVCQYTVRERLCFLINNKKVNSVFYYCYICPDCDLDQGGVTATEPCPVGLLLFSKGNMCQYSLFTLFCLFVKLKAKSFSNTSLSWNHGGNQTTTKCYYVTGRVGLTGWHANLSRHLRNTIRTESFFDKLLTLLFLYGQLWMIYSKMLTLSYKLNF